MPSDIKKAALALMLSCVSTLIAVYFEGLEYGEISLGDPLILGVNIAWICVVAWIIRDLLRANDIKATLILVGVILIVFLAWDLVEYGFGVPHLFYAFELAMFIVAYCFVSSKESKAWYCAADL
ncbi:MAG: hypothetical protein V4812_14640 [Pseudomonadota bacterium]